MEYAALSGGDKWTVDCVVLSLNGYKLDETEQAVVRIWRRETNDRLSAAINERLAIEATADV